MLSVERKKLELGRERERERERDEKDEREQISLSLANMMQKCMLRFEKPILTSNY